MTDISLRLFELGRVYPVEQLFVLLCDSDVSRNERCLPDLLECLSAGRGRGCARSGIDV